MAIAREIKDVRMMGYVYSLGQTNITVGFIPFVLTEIRRTVELYIKLFGMRNAKKQSICSVQPMDFYVHARWG